jgi:hypothetical protein
MSGTQPKRVLCFLLPLLIGIPLAAPADPRSMTYTLRGPGATLAWRSGDAAGTEVLLFAFTDQVAPPGSTPPSGPHVTFSVTTTTQVNGITVRRQWYGDAALKPKALTIGPGLASGKLDARVAGTLQEQNAAGVPVKREVSGRLQVRWTAIGPAATTTTSFVQQTPGYSVTLQSAGSGRTATATATLTVGALGAPLRLTSPGGLLAPSNGLLVVSLQSS